MYLLRSELKQEGPATTYIAMVESELERISGITKQTLRWNRETSETSERFEAGSMAEDVLRLFAGKIRNRQITVRVLGDRTVPLHGVLGQIRQVLANLVSNAIDAAPVHGHVTITMLKDDGRVGFSVQDDGHGIPEKIQKQLFEPFYSTKGDLGNGLGLYISKEIVERHGGTITVDSTEGSGAVMTVWLPAEQPQH
jgi:signal transduction histidine kinase